MTPISLEKIAAEWADKLLAGRVSFSTDLVAMPELQDEYLQRQAALIESQAAAAAAAWYRRNQQDPALVSAAIVAKLAEHIAVRIAMATSAHARADTAIAARLHVSEETVDQEHQASGVASAPR